MTEDLVQLHLCNYLREFYPEIKFKSDFGSGIKLTMGQAAKQKRLSSSRGWPDMFFPEPRGRFHGLFIELKKDKVRIYKKDGTPADDHIAEQLRMADELEANGYRAMICVGLDAAKLAVDNYFGQK